MNELMNDELMNEEAVSQSAMAEPCLWLRGILPANATAVPLPADHYDLIIDGTFELRPNSRIYLDGSGLHSSDVRIRRCGFSIVHRVGQHTVGTIHSALPGANQSTPRAELLALVILLELHGQSIAATDTPIISDCQYVRGRGMSKQGGNRPAHAEVSQEHGPIGQVQ